MPRSVKKTSRKAASTVTPAKPSSKDVTAVTKPKVPGARMSGVRHSGLLARDEEARVRGQGEREDGGKTELCFELDVAESDEGRSTNPSVSGKAIYSFRGRSRRTFHSTPAWDEGNASTTRTPQPKRSKVKITSRTDEDRSPPVSGEEDMELGDTIESATEKSKGSASRRKLSSDSDISDLSDDDDLRLVAARLNRGEAVGQVTEDLLEDYFTAHSSKSGLTSDHTLAKLAQPKMDQESVQSALSVAPSRFQGDYQLLHDEYKQMFSYWLFQISNGYNILLYGLGSKQKLLEEFRTSHLLGNPHLVINGFFPGLTMKQVLTDLSSSLLGHGGVSFKNTSEQAQFITTTLEREVNSLEKSVKSQGKTRHQDLFLLIHNIDGAMLRGENAQTALSILAQSPSIHVLASIDHINAPLLWDQKKLSRFNWLWHDVTTYEPYRQETSYENSLLVQQSGSLALSSLKNVTKSLTSNARGIFELLGRYQLENRAENEGSYLGMSFHDCYLKCREKFLVNSDLTLRAQLTEFKDHKLVRSRKGKDGVEYLFIPIDDAALGQFLEQLAEDT